MTDQVTEAQKDAVALLMAYNRRDGMGIISILQHWGVTKQEMEADEDNVVNLIAALAGLCNKVVADTLDVLVQNDVIPDDVVTVQNILAKFAEQMALYELGDQ